MTENLINDLLDLAKLQNNKFTLQNENFNLLETIHYAMKMTWATAKQKNVKLQASIDQAANLDLLSCVYGDKRRFT